MFICDKCKKPLESPLIIPSCRKVKKTVESLVINGKHYDICEDCYHDLKEFRDKVVAEFFGEGDEDGGEKNVRKNNNR